jgi:hypothetical protein
MMCGGAMGGLRGPGHGLYQQWGERWAERGVRVLRVGYREPNNLDLCAAAPCGYSCYQIANSL